MQAQGLGQASVGQSSLQPLQASGKRSNAQPGARPGHRLAPTRWGVEAFPASSRCLPQQAR